VHVAKGPVAQPASGSVTRRRSGLSLVLVRMPNAWVRKLFIPVIVLVAVSMLAHGAAWL
jgi:hypothetical protein